MENEKGKKEKQVDNLVNLVENHTRTERHLEQYYNIGDRQSKERASNKQDVREEEIDKLKNKIISNENESKIEQMQNLEENYKGAQIYMEENYEKIPHDNLKNMEHKQQNRKKQIENLSENIYEDEN